MGILMGYVKAPEDIKKGDLIAILADEKEPNAVGKKQSPYDWKNWDISMCDDRLFTGEPIASMADIVPLGKYGDLLTFEEYAAYNFGDNDGIGYYATETLQESKFRSPSQIDVKEAEGNRFTHIMWCNK